MSTCCGAPASRRSSAWLPTFRQLAAWALPSVILMLVPKCPACLAAHVLLWTGLGLSLSTATHLRSILLFLCIAALLYLIAKSVSRVPAILAHLKTETQPCTTKS